MHTIVAEWLRARLQEPSEQPQYWRLAQLLQQTILSGQLPSGSKLPSSRALGQALGMARNTVTRVYEQLQADGYVSSQTGSGTYVTDTAPERVLDIAQRPQPRPQQKYQRLSRRGQHTITQAGVSQQQWGAFMPGVPDVTQFPLKTWNRLQAQVWRDIHPSLMTYSRGGGWRPLRRALADYLRLTRAANCLPEQIIVTTGIHQSMDLAVRLLCDAGDEVWVEDPCYWGIRSVLHSLGVRLVPIAVDEQGISPTPQQMARPPRMIICTPSHQYPLGHVMSLARRRMLLEYARQHGCWIVEDDYDSEFRYGISPLAALQGLDRYGQVIYLGSFSKVLFPSLRVGYMVVPTALAEAFAQGLNELYREGHMLLHAVLAEFINEGYLAAHIRRMRALYAERCETLTNAITAHYGERFTVLGGQSGLHLVLALDDTSSADHAIAAQAQERGIIAKALSQYYHRLQTARDGLVLGYASVPTDHIAPAFDTLAQVIDGVCDG